MIVVIQNDDGHHAARQARSNERSHPMGHSQAEKAASRERILAAASAQIRAEGLESLSVGRLMAEAGLTHGGFYGHFRSRADLLAQALERALVDGEGGAKAADERRPGPQGLGGFV